MGRTVLYASSPRDSSILNLVVCIAGIYVCYLSYGIFQEKMYAHPHSPHRLYHLKALTFMLCRRQLHVPVAERRQVHGHALHAVRAVRDQLAGGVRGHVRVEARARACRWRPSR